MTQTTQPLATNPAQQLAPWMQAAAQLAAPDERRIRIDRRQRDVALAPGLSERRQRADRRLPEVEFLDFDDMISLQ